MRDKEKGKGLEVYQLAEIIENSSQIISWEGNIDDKQILIQLKEISQEDAQRLKELGLEFSGDFRWQTGERSPFSFWFDSAFTSPRDKLPELDIFDLTAFRDKEGVEGRALLFRTEKKERLERLFGLAKFGEKYDGIKQADVEPGFFALVIFLKR